MFNIEDFDIKLDTEIIGRNFIFVEELDSTNNYLMNNDNLPDGTVILAELQTAGKGRLKRTWTADKGDNITFSVLLDRKFKDNTVNIINLGISLAAALTLENLYQFDVNLKWPNDVLVSGKKIAGILLESSSKGNLIEKIVAGIGINVNQTQFPGKYNIPPTSIRNEFKKAVSRERFMSEMLNNFEAVLDKIDEHKDKVISDWKNRCRSIGEQIKLHDGSVPKYGVFEDIDQNGYLILRQGETRQKIHFGDVSVI